MHISIQVLVSTYNLTELSDLMTQNLTQNTKKCLHIEKKQRWFFSKDQICTYKCFMNEAQWNLSHTKGGYFPPNFIIYEFHITTFCLFLFKKKTVHWVYYYFTWVCVDIIFVLCFSVIQWSHSPDTHMASITWTSASCILRPFFMWSAWQLVCCRERGHLQ